MKNSLGDSEREYFVLWLWKRSNVETEKGEWLGFLESGKGKRTYFKTLEELNQHLRIIGWQDSQLAKKE